MRIKHNSIIWYPLVISIAIVLGIVIGNYISTKKFTLDKDRKINAVLNLIQSEYVDSIDVKDLVEQAIPAIIGNLDPHSYYIPASDIRAENEKLDGSMSGIGVSFFMMNDTANVDQVIPNGPAEKVGMLAGDRIISVNGESIVGGTLTAEGIRSKIRGEKGTKVRIGVKRNTSKKTLTFTITRDDIPMNTIDVSYMLDDKTGYIKIAQFGKNTYDEFFAALSKLKKDGASRYIVDLRGNPGGYMEMAILMVNEFLEQGELIVYTKGRKEREDIQVWSDDQGSFHDAQVAVLIDEYSASASEIMAGALQDNDRGLVVGRRSFGKGLVQKQIYLPDSSAIRLTIARYYTPSHRCIQKDYTLGDEDDYSKELYDRYSHGELYSADSIKVDKSKIFRTANGRIVYGGGGIVPDIFVPNDTTGITTYYRAVANLGLLQQYVYTYVDINRDQLKNVKTVKQLMGMMPSDDALTYDFVCYARDNGVPMRWYYINLSRSLIARQLRALVIRDVLGSEEFYRYYNRTDNTVNAALKALNDGKGKFPITLTSTKKKKGKR
ncbi:MAG: S41 family peptidase [Muribaculaceae bacterium]|jgi:peptidase, S41 family|uniref:S41 family peptidase n=1 Tax=Candidatus Limisoma sp. TaxID=3076476 RepID=UPI000334E506|nr:S41 family peptidase [Muribaculaceae bacterium]MEE0626241.1 S41 family peptidase [Muribaculaceae bacterium]CDE40931.1 c-terminal processing peptidase [Prevotella sp. CAG:279]